jgi:restriction-modification enzyme MmeI-like protein
MARLIFCFLAEKTGIFDGDGLFTATLARMSEATSGTTHEVIGTLFRAMNTKFADRAQVGLPGWAMAFPYVNGGLFSGSTDVPRFSRIARSYLLHVGSLDWKAINPDIPRSADTKANFVTRSPWRKKPRPCAGSGSPPRAACSRA